MDKKIDVVVIGAIIKETIKYPTWEMGAVVGSPAAYSSVVMAAQSLTVGLVTYYGNDMKDIISELDSVDGRGILPYKHTTTNRLVYREDGTKYIEYQKVTPNLRYEDINKDYLEADFYYICPMNYEVELELIKSLFDMGKTIIIDLGGYGGATSDVRHSVDTEYGCQVINFLCNNTTIVKASQEDLASIFPGKNAAGATKSLISRGASNVVVTIGEDGAFYQTKSMNIPVYKKSFKATSEMPDDILNYTGAGDSFGAGFIASFIVDRNIDKAVTNGNATASLVVQRPGGCTYARMPSREKVKERVETGH